MKIKTFPLSLIVTLLLTTVALGGDMPGPGALQQPPQTTAGETKPAICKPLKMKSGEVGGSSCQEATPVSTLEAMFFAFQALLKIY
jgi:hypothetical protein